MNGGRLTQSTGRLGRLYRTALPLALIQTAVQGAPIDEGAGRRQLGGELRCQT